MQRSVLRNVRGVALPVALFALVVIGALVAGIFFTARIEIRSGENAMSGARAMEAAQAGLQMGYPQVLSAASGLSDGQSVALTKTQLGTSGSYYQDSVTRLNKFMYLLRAYGTYEVGSNVTSTRVLAMLVKRYMPELMVNSGAIVVGNATVSGSANLDGHDQAPDGWSGCPAGTDQPGLRTNGTATLSGKGSVDGVGTPAYSTNDTTVTGMSRVMDTLFFQLASQANFTINANLNSSVAYNANGTCNKTVNSNWGDPERATPTAGTCETYFPIIYFNNGVSTTTYNIHGVGQGVMLVNGNLAFNGNSHYAGLILVRGSFQGGTGNISIDGSLLSLNADLSDDNVKGNIDLDYSSCAVNEALNNMSVTAPATYRGFIQF